MTSLALFNRQQGKMMKHVFANMLIGATVFSIASLSGAATPEAKAAYKTAEDKADADYKAARAQCDAMKGNPKDVCIAEAKAAKKRAKADAEAAYKNTPKEQVHARVEHAEADYDVAKTKCDALKGNDKDVCIKEAKAVKTKAIVDAKADKKVAELSKQVREDKSDANYKVELQKCDSLAGAAKDTCVSSAKAKYGK